MPKETGFLVEYFLLKLHFRATKVFFLFLFFRQVLSATFALTLYQPPPHISLQKTAQRYFYSKYIK